MPRGTRAAVPARRRRRVQPDRPARLHPRGLRDRQGGGLLARAVHHREHDRTARAARREEGARVRRRAGTKPVLLPQKHRYGRWGGPGRQGGPADSGERRRGGAVRGQGSAVRGAQQPAGRLDRRRRHHRRARRVQGPDRDRRRGGTGAQTRRALRVRRGHVLRQRRSRRRRRGVGRIRERRVRRRVGDAAAAAPRDRRGGEEGRSLRRCGGDDFGG
mmetsp:Transcript_1760/g.6873  ORF Transcript_1760/g.6873 Transcript_1760/m.6873 type:complete len:217 (+) Transcript_1760:204-854(+)